MLWGKLMQAVAALAAGTALALAASGASAAKSPKAPRGAKSVERFRVQLDTSASREWVIVYSKKGTRGTKSTFFDVFMRSRGRWKRAQHQRAWGPAQVRGYTPFRKAWVGDLNGDGLVEIATRNYASAAMGEELPIFRQRAAGSLRFSRLQSVSGSRVSLSTTTSPAQIKVTISGSFSPDGKIYKEIWGWEQGADRWRCQQDCTSV